MTVNKQRLMRLQLGFIETEVGLLTIWRLPWGKRPLGTSDVQITPILMGTWQAGKKMWVGVEDSETTKAIRAAFEAEITTIDTAEVYGDGHSKQIVAQALSDVREQVVYATKVFANHLRHDQVIEACDRSLKNLFTDYIDLYQIDWPSGSFN